MYPPRFPGLLPIDVGQLGGRLLRITERSDNDSGASNAIIANL